MLKPSIAALALCVLAAPLSARAGAPPSNAHADSAIVETKAARDGVVASGADDEAAFAARYDYAAALFNANRFADAAAELKAVASMKAIAKDTTNFVMTHAGLMIMDLALQDPKAAGDEFSLMEKRMPASFRETKTAQSYLTTVWFVKRAGGGKHEMGELFRPASAYEKLVISDPDQGTFEQYRLTVAGVGLRSALVKAKKPAKAGTIKLGELPALRNQL